MYFKPFKQIVLVNIFTNIQRYIQGLCECGGVYKRRCSPPSPLRRSFLGKSCAYCIPYPLDFGVEMRKRGGKCDLLLKIKREKVNSQKAPPPHFKTKIPYKSIHTFYGTLVIC